MATSVGDSIGDPVTPICLACGKEAAALSRCSLANTTVAPIIKRFLMRRLDELRVTLDKSSVYEYVRVSFLCRNCFSVYGTHVNKEKLYQAS